MLVSYHETAIAITIERPDDVVLARAEAERLIGLRRLNFIRRERDGGLQVLASVMRDRSVRSGQGFTKFKTDTAAIDDALRAVVRATEYRAPEWI